MKCEECSVESGDYPFCEDCADTVIHCEICKKYYWRDSLECSHIWWSAGHGDWIGPGVYETMGGKGIKDDFLWVMAKMGSADVVLRALQNRETWRFTTLTPCGGMGYSSVFWRLAEDEAFDSKVEALQDLEEIDEHADGIRWLMSLEPDNEARDRSRLATIAWLERLNERWTAKPMDKPAGSGISRETSAFTHCGDVWHLRSWHDLSTGFDESQEAIAEITMRRSAANTIFAAKVYPDSRISEPALTTAAEFSLHRGGS